MAIIEVQHLEHTYRTRGVRGRPSHEVAALRDISFEVTQGQVFGFLGPNGAGKTTTLKILATLLDPAGGSVTVDGFALTEHNLVEIRRRIGFTFGGDRGLYGRLSAIDNLFYFADLYGVDPKIVRQRAANILELVGLTDRAQDRVETFSRGMKQRLHIARVLIHDPLVVLLDEPTVGMDPSMAREVRRIIRQLALRGKTVVLSTHYMREAEAVCDTVLVIAKGRILHSGSPQNLFDTWGGVTVFEVSGAEALFSALDDIRVLPGVLGADLDLSSQRGIMTLYVERGINELQLLASLEQLGAAYVTRRVPTLEDAYLRCVGSHA